LAQAGFHPPQQWCRLGTADSALAVSPLLPLPRPRSLPPPQVQPTPVPLQLSRSAAQFIFGGMASSASALHNAQM